MSESLEKVAIAINLQHKKHPLNVLISSNHKRILKSKENLFKPKCNKELKRKLRKYKLRTDGNEDQDVLDVSQILVTSLRIKSPNNPDKIYTKNNKVESEELKPNNYLFKMVKKRKTCTQIETNIDNVNIPQNSDTINSILFDKEAQNNKEMDAFKLMMDSRNKSIGCNSPGKEKNSDETILQETVEKKAIKAKRILSLQKMAENKGSLKNKEIEKYRDLCIKKKMLKRAEALKDIITKQDTEINKKEHMMQSNTLNNISKTNPNKEIVNESDNLIQNDKTLKLCDIFSDTNTIINESKALERASDEDIEFLKKLSPSIRKKENMLSYFKKVSKETELTSEHFDNNYYDKSCKSVIKVKFTHKQNKKINALKSSQELDSISANKYAQKKDLLVCKPHEFDNNEHIESKERNKRKRNKKAIENTLNSTMEIKDNNESSNNENRPKRHTKKPIKYTEDEHCFSSDEELHIFTPKKKRNSDKILKPKRVKIVQAIEKKNIVYEIPSTKSVIGDKLRLSNESKLSNNLLANRKNKVTSQMKKELKHIKTEKGKKLNSIKTKNEKKSVKLAPIFVTKPQLSQAAVEAKQRFLKSGVPEKLKKSIVLQTNSITILDNFHLVLHIQQSESCSNFQGKDWLKLTSHEIEDINTDHNYSFKSFLVPPTLQNLHVPLLKYNPGKVLKSIKKAYPKFPVYRTYHKLRSKSKGDCKDFNYTDLDNSIEIVGSCTEVNNDYPERLNWCDKYKPTSSNQIIGNFESIKELKRWLETWNEKLIKSKTNGSDSSDMSDFYSSDIDTRDATRTTNNILIVTGQTGSGKTSSVYAVAAELAIKVIEVNASSKRNGKIMLQDLQEATQSHKVNRAKNGIESSQKLQEIANLTNSKKRGRPKKGQEAVTKTNKSISIPETLIQASSSQECLRTGMSLILIDDADIVFDQDDGFCSAISQLIQSSKRPVILVTSSLSCPHLQRFLQNGKIIHMHPLLPRILGTWLDIMCLVDVGKCSMGLGEKLLDFYRGDIRKTINCLQFYMNSYKNTSETDELVISQAKCNIDDENSSMSWADAESLEGDSSNEFELLCKIDKQMQLLPFASSTNVFDIWWSLTSNFNGIKNNELSHLKNIEIENSTAIKKLAASLDMLCTIDYIDHIKPDKTSNTTSTPWYSSESASLLENEDFYVYNKAHSLSKEIANVLMVGVLSETRRVLKTEGNINGHSSSMSFNRERDRIVSRHNTLSNYLNPSAILDRRATALDYWPSCRTICRLEKNKTDYNIKRNNRFCHYLKSLNILCKNDFFDNLADSLT